MAEQLQQHDFASRLHTRFQVLDDQATTGGPCELELIEVSEERRTPQQAMFWVVFRGPSQPFLPQQTYRLSQEGLGERPRFEHALFLVPVGQDAQGFHYQAVFNRLKEKSA